MNPSRTLTGCLVAALAAGAAAVAAPGKGGAAARKAAPAPAPSGPAMTVAEARQTVRMLDDAYQTTLHEIHRWYPTRTGRAVVAATVVKDLQKKMGEQGWPRSRFLAVSGILMNPDHRPLDTFERQAVSAIKGGKQYFEAVEDGRFRAATLVPLNGGCFSCHWSEAGQASRAAISWNIPLKRRP
jgi:hypothetical protein